MPRGGPKTVHAQIKLKRGAILFAPSAVLICEDGKERPATPTESAIAKMAARYRSLWLKQRNKRNAQAARPNEYYEILAALVRVAEALRARKYDAALAIATDAIANAKRETK